MLNFTRHIEVRIYDPVGKGEAFVADVYVDGERRHCGRGKPNLIASLNDAAGFRDCLMAKCSRGTDAVGKGNRAKRRIARMKDEAAECGWCGQRTGNARVKFCDRQCAMAYHN